MSIKTLTIGLSPFRSSSISFPVINPTSSPPNRNPKQHQLGYFSRFLNTGPSASFSRLRAFCSSSSAGSNSLDFPLLPFQPDEVLVPSECKTLHLYEARFLALLEESLTRRKRLFVHFVLDPVILSGSSSAGASFAVRYACLVLIENITRLDIGALVSIRGIGRVTIGDITQTEPYLRGVVLPMQDNIPEVGSEIDLKVEVLRGSLHNLNSLQIKLEVRKDEPMQTHLKNSLTWADKEDFIDCDQAFIPKLAERISFVALQPISGSTSSELLALQEERLRGMESRDTSERLTNGIELAKRNIAMVAAKLAIQSLEM